VVLPEKLLKTLEPSGLRDVLVHEYAHALRRDPLIGLVQRLAAIVYWPYPLVHFLNRRLAWAREEVCDNYVLQQGDAASYAETLLTISQTFFSKPARPIALGLFHPYGRLERRVADLLDPRRNVMVRIHHVALTVLAVLFSTAVVVVACTRLLHAEPPPAVQTPGMLANPKLPAEKLGIITTTAPQYRDVAKLDYSGQSLGGDGSALWPTGYTVATVSDEKSATTKIAVSFAGEQAGQDSGKFHVMAIDKQNKRHKPTDENSVMGGGTKTRVFTIVSEFSLPAKEIAALVVQQSGEPELPRERSMVSLPAYRVEPPDVLTVEMLKMAPRAPYHIKTFDVLQIRAIGVLPPPNDIDGFFLVEAEGVVTLGPAYGWVRVAGMTIGQANRAIFTKLQETFGKPEVMVQLAKTAGFGQITGQYLIGPDGTINLRQYGTLHVAGMTVAEVRKALNKHLEQFFDSPDASVDVGKFNSKVYYLITEGIGVGSNIRRIPITGNDTVLDALSSVNTFWHVSDAKIWIARPASDGLGREQMLAVDYDAITHRASAATNYQIMPGDRVFIVTKPDPRPTPAASASPVSTYGRANNKQVKDFPEKTGTSLNLIQPFDLLQIRAVGTIQNQPIDGFYLVEPDGRVALGTGYGRVNVNGLTWEQAEKKIMEHLKTILTNPEVQVSLSRRGVGPWREAVLPKTPYKIDVYDVLQVRAAGTLRNQPIDGFFLVEPTGTLALGPTYGRAEVKGSTPEEAEKAIQKKLAEILSKPNVQVTLFRWADQREHWRAIEPPKASYTISPGALLSIGVWGTIKDQPIAGTYTVEPTGTVALGPAYGRAQVQGLTLDAAEKAIQKKLAEILKNPEVQVTFAGWKDGADMRSIK
jgi:polysaccharide biosynthesis/export protein